MMSYDVISMYTMYTLQIHADHKVQTYMDLVSCHLQTYRRPFLPPLLLAPGYGLSCYLLSHCTGFSV